MFDGPGALGITVVSTSKGVYTLLPARSSRMPGTLISYVPLRHEVLGEKRQHVSSRSTVVVPSTTFPRGSFTAGTRVASAWSSASGNSTVRGSDVPAGGGVTRQPFRSSAVRSSGPLFPWKRNQSRNQGEKY